MKILKSVVVPLFLFLFIAGCNDEKVSLIKIEKSNFNNPKFNQDLVIVDENENNEIENLQKPKTLEKKIYYVIPKSLGNKDGLNWENGIDLNSALTLAEEDLKNKKTKRAILYLAEGNYYPKNTIKMIPNIDLYGGFVKEGNSYNNELDARKFDKTIINDENLINQELFLIDDSSEIVKNINQTKIDGIVIRSIKSKNAYDIKKVFLPKINTDLYSYGIFYKSKDRNLFINNITYENLTYGIFDGNFSIADDTAKISVENSKFINNVVGIKFKTTNLSILNSDFNNNFIGLNVQAFRKKEGSASKNIDITKTNYVSNIIGINLGNNFYLKHDRLESDAAKISPFSTKNPFQEVLLNFNNGNMSENKISIYSFSNKYKKGMCGNECADPIFKYTFKINNVNFIKMNPDKSVFLDLSELFSIIDNQIFFNSQKTGSIIIGDNIDSIFIIENSYFAENLSNGKNANDYYKSIADFESLHNSTRAGAIYFAGLGKLHIRNSTFENNIGLTGNVLHVNNEKAEVFIVNSFIYNNGASYTQLSDSNKNKLKNLFASNINYKWMPYSLGYGGKKGSRCGGYQQPIKLGSDWDYESTSKVNSFLGSIAYYIPNIKTHAYNNMIYSASSTFFIDKIKSLNIVNSTLWNNRGGFASTIYLAKPIKEQLKPRINIINSIVKRSNFELNNFSDFAYKGFYTKEAETILYFKEINKNLLESNINISEIFNIKNSILENKYLIPSLGNRSFSANNRYCFVYTMGVSWTGYDYPDFNNYYNNFSWNLKSDLFDSSTFNFNNYDPKITVLSNEQKSTYSINSSSITREMGSLELYKKYSGLDVSASKDLNGNLRLSNSNIDIGAIEFQE